MCNHSSDTQPLFNFDLELDLDPFGVPPPPSGAALGSMVIRPPTAEARRRSAALRERYGLPNYEVPGASSLAAARAARASALDQLSRSAAALDQLQLNLPRSSRRSLSPPEPRSPEPRRESAIGSCAAGAGLSIV